MKKLAVALALLLAPITAQAWQIAGRGAFISIEDAPPFRGFSSRPKTTSAFLRAEAVLAIELESLRGQWNVAILIQGRTMTTPMGSGAAAESHPLRFSFPDRDGAEAFLKGLSDALVVGNGYLRQSGAASNANGK